MWGGLVVWCLISSVCGDCEFVVTVIFFVRLSVNAIIWRLLPGGVCVTFV